MSSFTPRQLQTWCSVPAAELVDHPDRRIPLRVVADPAEMARVMAEELVDAIAGRPPAW